MDVELERLQPRTYSARPREATVSEMSNCSMTWLYFRQKLGVPFYVFCFLVLTQRLVHKLMIRSRQ